MIKENNNKIENKNENKNRNKNNNKMNNKNISNHRFIAVVILLMTLLVFGMLISFMAGVKFYSLNEVFAALFKYKNIESHNIIREIRMPREIAALIVGMALAVSGAVMQGITKNALADPSLIGLNSGAAVAIAVLMAIDSGAHFLLIMLAGFIGAVAGGSIVLLIGMSRQGGFNPMRIILAGAAVSAMLSAIAEGIQLYFKLNQGIMQWSAGGVTGSTWGQLAYAAPIIIIIIAICAVMGRQLTVMSLGEELAQGLGLNTSMMRVTFSVMTMLLAGVAVALVGNLAFVGLMVPHIARFLTGTDYKKIIPVSALLGGIFIVGADIIARLTGESPLGAIVSIIGVPFFIYLVRRDGKVI